MSGFAAASKRRWKRTARRRCRPGDSLILCASFLRARSRSTSTARTPPPFAVDRAFLKSSVCLRKNFRRYPNSRTPRSSPCGRRICATDYARLPTPFPPTKRVTFSTGFSSASRKTSSHSWPPMAAATALSRSRGRQHVGKADEVDRRVDRGLLHRHPDINLGCLMDDDVEPAVGYR